MFKYLYISLIVTAFVVIINFIINFNYNSNILTLKYTNIFTTNAYKTILYWDTFYLKKDFGLGFGSSIFKNCKFKSCLTTNNKTLMAIEQFDAVIFHGARFKIHLNGIPEKRSDKQKYIFFSLESAFNTHFEEKTINDFYNWTLTFRKNSDLYYPYGIIRKKSTNYTESTNFLNRTKSVAWFASNCIVTPGARMRLKYVNELEKLINLDIYGRCGQLKCAQIDKCYQMLEKTYKFYLAFENSYCDDYVTEKLFNVLKLNIIPVVMGHANYSTIAPPNSVINIKDFITPNELSEYLLKLEQNETEYLKYFKWKTNYIVEDRKEEMLCELCEKLHKPLQYSSYENIREWFFQKCTSD